MKTIFFDFDGTLTYTSLNFWKKLWSSLGFSIDEGSYYKELFNAASNGEISHQKWCDKICEKFSDAGLTREMLLDIANTIELMDGFAETMQELKNRGYRLIIVSGNILQVINHNLKEYNKFFYKIYANSFEFDSSGRLSRIIGTKYDNQGKAKLIKAYASRTKSNLSDIWFVGNGGNDEWVYTTGCNTLLINPYHTKKHDDTSVWKNQIRKLTNLKQILEIIK